MDRETTIRYDSGVSGFPGLTCNINGVPAMGFIWMEGVHGYNLATGLWGFSERI
jgi:hypothetical protein